MENKKKDKKEKDKKEKKEAKKSKSSFYIDSEEIDKMKVSLILSLTLTFFVPIRNNYL